MGDLERYLDEIVEPTIEDLRQNPTSVRHAFLACVVVFHSIDYLTFPKSSRGVRQKFRIQSREFAVVEHVAHAFKHVAAGKPARPHLTASEVIRRPPAFWGVMEWGLSRWGDPTGGVTLDRARDVDLLETVTRATEFFRKQTNRLQRRGPRRRE